VLEVYGPDSPEYRRFRYFRIWHGPLMVNMRESEIQRSFAEGIPDLIGALENLIRRLEERKADFGADTTSRVRSAFEGLDLHPRIASVCADLYRGGHYRNAVLDASVALVNYVKEKSRKHDLDGSGLMTTVFSKNRLRNPRAHALLDDSPEMALEYIALISLLAKRLDQAKRTTP